MRKMLFSLLLGIGSLASLPAIAGICGQGVDVDLCAGYRQDHFRWSITHLPIKSELQWKDLQIAQVSAAIKCTTSLGYLRINGDYGRICSGKNQDSDFFFPGSSSSSSGSGSGGIEFSRSVNDAGRGHVSDVSIGYGYTMISYFNAVHITPLIGYSQHEQNLHMFKGRQKIDLVNGYSGSFSGLNSTYKARWRGFWAGVDFTYDYSSCLSTFASIEYHWNTTYHASGHWNLRSDFVDDFKQHANGFGVLATAGFTWQITRIWSAGLTGGYLNFATHKGNDRVFLRRGYIDSQLNRVNWHSFNVMAIVTASF